MGWVMLALLVIYIVFNIYAFIDLSILEKKLKFKNPYETWHARGARESMGMFESSSMLEERRKWVNRPNSKF